MSIEMIVAREKSPSTPEIRPETGTRAPGSPILRAKVLTKSDSQMIHEEVPASSVETLNELGLRSYVSALASSGLLVHSTLLAAPTAIPEVASSLPELFWKLVERRIHAATFTYVEAGKLREDVVRVTPQGYSLVRT